MNINQVINKALRAPISWQAKGVFLSLAFTSDLYNSGVRLEDIENPLEQPVKMYLDELVQFGLMDKKNDLYVVNNETDIHQRIVDE